MGVRVYLFITFICIHYMTPTACTALYPDCGKNIFRRVPSNNNLNTTEDLITTKQSYDGASCTTECFRNMACVAAILDMAGICYLHSNYLILNSGNAQTSQGAVYYEFIGEDECTTGSHTCTPPAFECEDTPRSYRCVCGVGYTLNGTSCTVIPMSSIMCTSDADCLRDNTKCQSDNACVCKLGYSHNPPDETCVEACVTYGNEFVRQSTGWCITSGGKSKGEESLNACKAACVSEGGGTCKVIQRDIDEGECFTFQVTYLDMVSDWESVEECRYYQRSCAP